MTQRRITRSAGRITRAMSASLLAAICLFPLLWMVSTALKEQSEVIAWPPSILPRRPTLDSFSRLFRDTSFLTYLTNSIWVALVATFCGMSVACAAAYGLTRFSFKGRETISTGMLMLYMFPPILLIVPLYLGLKGVGLVNSRLGLVLSYTAFTLPLTTWLLRAFFRGIPIELEEAAWVDGASRLLAFFAVVLPIALPGIIATSVFTFIVAWNDFLFARVIISSDELKTLPVGVQDLFQWAVVDWGMIMAAGVVIAIPVVLFYTFTQRYLVKGWGAGGLKG